MSNSIREMRDKINEVMADFRRRRNIEDAGMLRLQAQCERLLGNGVAAQALIKEADELETANG